MPNHVYTDLFFQSKEDFEKVVSKYCTPNKNGELEFDFNKLIRMPKTLDIEFSSKANDALVYTLFISQYNGVDVKEDIHYVMKAMSGFDKKHFSEAFNKERIQKILENYPDTKELLKLGKIQINNAKKYGVLNWYEWRIKNWGTKWNACDTEIDRENNSIHFWTAWSFAETIFEKLAAKEKKMHFSVEFADELIGENAGFGSNEKGEFVWGYND